MHLTLSANLNADDKKLTADLDANFISIAKASYIKLNKLESSDERITSIKPFIDAYSKKWLHLAEDFLPKQLRDIQSEDEAMKLKREQFEDLFTETKLFDVVKEYGVEKLNGKSVYHYELAVNLEGFKDYMSKAAVIDGRELTDKEVEDSVKVLSYVNKAEVYIDSHDYYVSKAVLEFNGAAVDGSSDLNISLSLTGTGYNKSISIKAPKDFEEFNPLELMGIPPTSSLTDDAIENIDLEEIKSESDKDLEVSKDGDDSKEVSEE